MAKVQIKNRYDSNVVVYECEAPEGTENTMKFAIEKAVAEKANLRGAYLGDANLSGANLSGANLGGANLSGANLGGANLSGANLGGANLGGANLRGAYLGGANLSDAYLGDANLGDANLSDANLSDAYLGGADLGGANLGGANLGDANLGGANLSGANLGGANLSDANLGGANTDLVGDRPYFSIGPIGSRQDNLTLWITEKGPLLKTGCFGPDTFEAFRGNLERDHSAESTHRKEYEAALLMCEAHAVLWTPKTVEA